MLSDEAIEKLIQPIIDRQEAINSFVLEQIAKKIKEVGNVSASDVHKLERMLRMGGDARRINTELAKLTNLQVMEIKSLIRNVAKDIYLDAKPFYDYRKLPYIPFEKNKPLQRIVNSMGVITANEYKNLTNAKSIGFVVQDKKRPGKLVFKRIDRVYTETIDKAIQAVSGGVLDYSTAIRKTITELVDSGVRKVYWDSGYTQRLDTAVKRQILDGVRAVNMQVQQELGKEFGANGVELTAHARPAPDHAPVQGRQFYSSEFAKMQAGKSFKDSDGNRYIGFDRHIGELNCKHLAYSIIVGVRRVYSDKQLKKILEDNEKGYTTKDGKHFTGYECLQYQNQLAVKVRRAKDGQMMAETAGNPELAAKYRAKVVKYTKMYKQFAKDAGISVRSDKLTVPKYRK